MLEETTPPTFPIENENSASAFLMDSNLRVVVVEKAYKRYYSATPCKTGRITNSEVQNA
jgi:hypothetical protein